MNGKTRRGKRVACNDKCLLIFNGDIYPCKLENISISGVLVQYDGANPAPVSPGDRCGFLLCRDPKVCPGEYPARVARSDTERVALQFLDM